MRQMVDSMITQNRPRVLLVLSMVALCSLALIGAASAVSVEAMADNPFQFEDSTPPPTSPSQPTSTPEPTPRPEPSAWPTLEMSVTTSASASNPKVEISGSLTYNNSGIESAPIYAAFSADGGSTWQNFSLVQTKADGSFSTVWMPNSTGNYLLSAQWDGNLTLHWLTTTLSLALTPDTDGNQFSVVSNSSIADLTYDSATRQLSFVTNTTTESAGHLYITVPKTLVGDANMLQLKIDGTQHTFSSESRGDVWVVSCLYPQSEHLFTVHIPQETVFTPSETPWVAIVGVLVIVVAVVLVLLVVFRRRRRTAAVVAEILKSDRPVY